MSLSFGTIRRRYEQGLDSIVRLVIGLEDRIEDLTAMQVAAPQRLIKAQSAEIKRLQQTVANKDAELVEAHQINRQLQIRIRELEKFVEAGSTVAEPLIKRDSHNSNQPPSLDLPWTKPKRTRSLRKQSGLKVGGQPGHEGVTLRQVAVPDRIIIHSIEECRQCGASLTAEACRSFHKRQVFEIENGSLATVEHQTPIKICPVCGTFSKGQFPFAVKAPAQYGGSEVIGADETGIRISGTNAWVHVARTDTLTHLASHSNRGQAAFNAIGILNQFKGTLVRDGWFSYKWYEQCKHSLCNAHLLRDLTYIGESEPLHEPWTTALAKLLVEIKESVEEARNCSEIALQGELHESFLNRYDALTAQAEEAVRGSPEQKSKGLTAGKLLNRFIKSKAEVLCFMTDFAVPFDNNGSERDLRILKLQQKIAGCFRTAEGVQTFCRVRSYLSSARKQDRVLLTALESALKGKPIVLTK